MELENINAFATLNNNIRIPYLGLGVYKVNDGEEVINSVLWALEAGYRLIDTASYYRNEKGVGEAISKSGIPRNEIFVTSKVWNDDQGFENTIKAFNSSLNQLNLDYIDLYLIHWPVPGKYLQTWKALESIYLDGKIKAVGLSNCVETQVQKVIDTAKIKPMVLQNEFHPRLQQNDLINFCKTNEIQYQGWSPLMRGRMLQNKVIKFIGEKYDKSPAQVILRWGLQKGIAVIPKSTHKSRIRENANIFDFNLVEVDIKLIDALDTGERTGAHPENFLNHFRSK